MKSYRYVQLNVSDSGVVLYSTDSQVMDWMLTELKEITADFRVSESKSFSGEKYRLYIDKLRGRDRTVGWWMLRQLCLQGWEPFAAHTVPGSSLSNYVYHLRFEGQVKT